MARQIGTVLVEKQLAACMNLIPGVESIYRWQGQVETASEVLAVIKTSVEVLPTLLGQLAELHPYEVPEILVLEPAAVAASYRSWVLGAVTPPTS